MRDFKEQLKRWRKLLEPAKPEDWKWQPPLEIEPVTPKEPPENIKAQLGDFIAKLPDLEREILNLRFVNGLSSEEIAQMLGSKKVFVTVIERGAIERLAETVGTNESEIYSWLAWWGKKRSEAIEAEMANLPSRQPSPDCPSLDRIYVAHLRWDWTEQERQHIRSCEYCRFMAKKIRERIWHPSSAQLWKYVTQGELSEAERLDVRYHLETDSCRRCKFIVGNVLMPVASLVPNMELRYESRTRRFRFLSYPAESLTYDDFIHYLKMEGPTTFAQLTVAASSVPVALSVEGFAGDVQEEVKVEEGLFRAQLKREQRGWIARAEATNVPSGSKALFIWLTSEGIEKIRREAEFKPAFRDWSYAEALMASESEQLGEGFFVAALLPPFEKL